MDLRSLQVPAAAVVSIVMGAIAVYSWVASKEYVEERRAQDREVQQQIIQSVEKNTKNSGRSLSLTLADKLSLYYNRLCYENLKPSDRERIRDVIIPRWEQEYSELTGRTYDPGICDQ